MARGECRGLLERRSRRFACDDPLVRDRKFGERAHPIFLEPNVDLVADREARNLIADRIDDTGGIAAERVRALELQHELELALADLEVERTAEAQRDRRAH